MPGAKEKPAARKSKSGAKNGTRLDGEALSERECARFQQLARGFHAGGPRA